MSGLISDTAICSIDLYVCIHVSITYIFLKSLCLCNRFRSQKAWCLQHFLAAQNCYSYRGSFVSLNEFLQKLCYFDGHRISFVDFFGQCSPFDSVKSSNPEIWNSFSFVCDSLLMMFFCYSFLAFNGTYPFYKGAF